MSMRSASPSAESWLCALSNGVPVTFGSLTADAAYERFSLSPRLCRRFADLFKQFG